MIDDVTRIGGVSGDSSSSSGSGSSEWTADSDMDMIDNTQTVVSTANSARSGGSL
jgi:hypothetical protein